MTNKEKFLQLVSDRESGTLKRNRWMIANREMLRENQDFALYIFQRLDEKGITLDDFRRKLDDKEESFTKLIHGKLETYISDNLFKQIELLLL